MNEAVMVAMLFYVMSSSVVIVCLIVSNRLRTTKNRDDIRELKRKMEEGL